MSEDSEAAPQPVRTPPSGTLPGVVALELVLAQSGRAAVYVPRLAVYPVGFELDVVTVTHPEADSIDPLLFAAPSARGARAEERLRLGIAFGEGALTTNVGGAAERIGAGEDGPLLVGVAGRDRGGRDGSWRRTFWVSPLPPPGPVRLSVAWPGAEIEPTEERIDAEEVLEAGRRAIVIFDEE